MLSAGRRGGSGAQARRGSGAGVVASRRAWSDFAQLPRRSFHAGCVHEATDAQPGRKPIARGCWLRSGPAVRSRRATGRPMLILLGGLALVAAACREPEPTARRGDDVDLDPGVFAGARRPSRVHVLARSAERCELLSVEDATRSRPTPTPCPPELLEGERIRFAGDACLREGIADRARPVVCPEPLVEQGLQDRRSADTPGKE